MANKKKSRRNNKKTKKTPPLLASPSSSPSTSSSGCGSGRDHQAVTSLAKAMTLECYHGSTAKKFTHDSDYCRAVWKVLSFCHTVRKLRARGKRPDFDEFARRNQRLIRDTEFGTFLFAICTSVYLSNNYAVNKAEQGTVEVLLSYGLHIKYVYKPLSEGKDISPGSAIHERYIKYCRDARTERGTINCLSRETKEFCDCMATKKEKAKTMEKLGRCYGCNKLFPKGRLFKCNNCHCHQYCSNKCQSNDWPNHRMSCMNLTIN